MKNLAVCPICGEGHLTKRMEMDEIVYKSKTKQVTDTYYICDHCHIEQSGAKELKSNKRTMNEFKKEVDGLLTGREVFDIRNSLGLTQEQAALVFGGGPNAFTKYENNDVIQSESIDKLMRLAYRLPAAFSELCDMAGIKQEHSKMFPRSSMAFTYSGDEFSIDTKNMIITSH